VTEGRGPTPLPITFLGLTIATTLYAGFETQILPAADFHTMGWLVLAIPVPMQFVPSVWAWIRGELAAATASSLLGTTWLALAIAAITGPVGAPGPSKAESLFVFAAAAGLLVSLATEIVDRRFIGATVLVVATCRFVLTGVSGLTHSQGWATTAGVAGFVLAGVALAAALVVELRYALSRN
jgi:hypothetical protein